MRDEFNRCLDNLEIDLIASVVETVREAVGDDVDMPLTAIGAFRQKVQSGLRKRFTLSSYFGLKTQLRLIALMRWHKLLAVRLSRLRLVRTTTRANSFTT